MEVAGRTDADIARSLLVARGRPGASGSTSAPTTCGSPPARPTRGCAPTTCRRTSRPACAELLAAARRARRHAARARDRQLRADRAPEAAPPPASARFFAARPGRLRLRPRGPRRAAGDRAPARRRRATASRGRARARCSSATRRATSPARAPTACASSAIATGPVRAGRAAPRPTPSRATPRELGALLERCERSAAGGANYAGRHEQRRAHRRRARGDGRRARGRVRRCCRPATTTSTATTPTHDARPRPTPAAGDRRRPPRPTPPSAAAAARADVRDGPRARRQARRRRQEDHGREGRPRPHRGHLARHDRRDPPARLRHHARPRARQAARASRSRPTPRASSRSSCTARGTQIAELVVEP